jgi:thymidylate synthase
MQKLTQFDLTMYTIISDIKNNGASTHDGNVRPLYEDGVPAHSYYQTNVCEVYNNPCTDVISTLRPLAWKSAIKEILWIYQDQSNSLDLLEEKYGITWWRPWDIGDGTIGQRYGATVKKYDLMNKLLKGLKEDPYSRRHIMTLYQYQDFDETGGLHPCAMETIWNVRKGKLDLLLIQRSSDYLVANAINKIQYVALQMMVAKHVGLEVGKFVHLVANLHIYDRHMEQADELISRYLARDTVESDREGNVAELVLKTDKTNFYDFTIDDFDLINYKPNKPQLQFDLGI